MKRLTVEHLSQEDLDRLGIDDAGPGWYVHDPNNPDVEWVGEYSTKTGATEGKAGLTQFYRMLEKE